MAGTQERAPVGRDRQMSNLAANPIIPSPQLAQYEVTRAEMEHVTAVIEPDREISLAIAIHIAGHGFATGRRVGAQFTGSMTERNVRSDEIEVI